MAGRVAVAFGSNLGDRRGHILWAAERVAAILDNFTLSPLIETAPVGVGLENDPSYLNAVGVGDSSWPAADILAALGVLETERGRTRPQPGAPRTLDLDLILAGDQVVEEENVRVPHPRFRDRRFVLEPLASVAPDLVDPVTGRTIRELLGAVREKGPRR
jgi:2-amino-4-hydroxy-6-hydroxymethyldihydropteridine diphosphokinase